MSWDQVGDWLKSNAGTGAALVGSLLTGNVPAAVAAGVSLVSSATGTADPAQVLSQLQQNPDTVVRLKELAIQDDANIRAHIAEMTRLDIEEHRITQDTIRAGDVAEDKFVKRTRPGQSWLSLVAAIVYVFTVDNPDIMILSALLTLPFAYAGLRQVGKGIDSVRKIRNDRRAS